VNLAVPRGSPIAVIMTVSPAFARFGVTEADSIIDVVSMVTVLLEFVAVYPYLFVSVTTTVASLMLIVEFSGTL